MPARISPQLRREVIRRRILQQSFDKIAADLGISHGAAVNIFNQWKEEIGKYEAESILDFAKALKELKMTPEQCFEGAEISGILRELGTTYALMHKVVSELFQAAIHIGLRPEQIAQLLLEVTELSSKFAIPLIDIPKALEDAEAKRSLVKGEAEELWRKYEDTNKELEKLLHKYSTTEENICKCVDAESKLKELGLTLLNLVEVITVIHNVKELGTDPAKVASVFSSISSLQTHKEKLTAEINAAEEKLRKTREETQTADAVLASRKTLKEFLDKFIALGFSQVMLEKLLQVIQKVAITRGIPFSQASGDFLSEVEGSYDTLKGFEETLATLRGRLTQVNIELAVKEKAFAEYKDAVDSWQYLDKRGVEEKDLLYWQKVLRDHPTLTAEMLTECLRTYADFKTAILALEESHKISEIRKTKDKEEIEALQKEKERVISELEKLRKEAEETRQEEKRKFEQLREEHEKLHAKAVKDAIGEAVQKALLAGIELKAAPSPLLRIIKWENGSTIPTLEEKAAAAVYTIDMVRTEMDSTDPLKSDLERLEAALKLKVGKAGGSSAGAV